jgi:spore germination protein GerM
VIKYTKYSRKNLQYLVFLKERLILKYITLILMIMLILVGCDSENSNTKLDKETNNEVSKDTTKTDDNDINGSDNLEETNDSEENIDDEADNTNNENSNDDLDKDNSNVQAEDSYQKKFILYFIKDDDTNYLFETEEVEITVFNNQTANAVIKELLKSQNAERNKIPTGTNLNSINLVNGILYVDLSEEFKNNINLGSGYETMMVYSIVNSLTELDGINKVQFKIEGEIINYLSHISIENPFSQNIQPIGN